jgi:hypothetical protein
MEESMEVIRLGDVIDDHCSRCRMVMDHSVMAIVGGEVKKVVCRTCNHEHDYRHGKGPQKKAKTTKLSAYEQVLASVTAAMPGSPTGPPPQKTSTSPRGRTRPFSRGSRSLQKR